MKVQHICFLAVSLLAHANAAKAEITIKEATTVDGKEVCSKGSFLIEAGACLKHSDISEYSIEEIHAALMARKDPDKAKIYEEAISYKKANGIPVYKTKINEEKSDILKLENGAIVEVKIGFVGFVGWGKKAILYLEAGSWKLWIEGKKSFPVEILKNPTTAPRYVTSIGETLELLD